MFPPIVLTVISITQAALQAVNSEQVKAVIDDARKIFDWLFVTKVITVAQQNQLKAWCDACMESALAGVIPPEFTVEPDPE